TQAGILKGKFGYMSPEQIRGMPLDRRSDIFAIGVCLYEMLTGVCLYEMLTGERLFVGDSDFSVLEKVRKAEVPPPSTYNRRIPEALEKIVLKALARDVDERYQYANELGDDLQRFLITSESIFSRKDLMQYMKSTFAEDVEREKLRLQEYADIKPPEGMMAAIEMGFSGASSAPPPPPVSAPVPSLPPVEPSQPPVGAGGVRRSPTLGALPKLTAAPPAPKPPVQEEESGATMVVNSSEYFDEPTTQPGMVGPGRTVTPVEVPRPLVIDEQPAQRVPGARMSQPVTVTPAPARAPTLSPASAESTTVARQGRNTMDGLPRVVRPDPSAESPGVARPSQSVPTVPGRPSFAPLPMPPVAPPKEMVQEEEEVEASTSPALPARPLPGSARPQERGPAPASAPAPAAPNRLPLIAGLAALVVLLLVTVAFLAMRPEPKKGYILVSLPADVRDVRVNVSGQDLNVPKSGPILQEVPAGPALVLVSAAGYKPFTQQMEIQPGTTPTNLEVKLQREVQVARVVVVTQPPDAEVKVDGKVVREKGSSSTYIGEVPAETEVVVSASAPGYKPADKRLNLPAGDKPMDVQLKLEPEGYEVEVQSVPAGAAIFVEGKDLGRTTPARVRLPTSVKQVSLKLRCHDEASVDVAPAMGTVKERLKKQRGCR
uniref:serine/threonine protein kinase n=1 Tax=Archangium lipolyticum TaxID=2970465 RepID=UPI002149EF2F